MKNYGKLLPIGVALTIGLTACGGSSEAAPSSEPTEAPVVATPSPTAAPSSSFEPTPTESSQPTVSESGQSGAYTYLDLKEMSATEFIDLPLSDRAVFMHGMLDYFEEWQTGHLGRGIMEDDTSDLYEFNPNNTAKPDNSVEEIIKQVLYSENVIRMQTANLDMASSTFDLDMATKVAAGLYVSPDYINDTSKDTVETDEKNAVDSEKHFSMLIGELQHQGAEAVKYAQTIDTIQEESNIREVTDTDGNTRYVATLKYTLSEGLQEAHPSLLEDGVKYVSQEAVYSEDESLWLLTKSEYTTR